MAAYRFQLWRRYVNVIAFSVLEAIPKKKKLSFNTREAVVGTETHITPSEPLITNDFFHPNPSRSRIVLRTTPKTGKGRPYALLGTKMDGGNERKGKGTQ